MDPQNDNRGATDERAPRLHRALPVKMFTPPILARMEQPCDFTRDWINAGKVGAFVTVTVDATRREILGVRRAAVLFNDDMVNPEVQPGALLRKVAILAAERGSLPDEFHQVPLHTGSRSRVLRLEGKERLRVRKFNEPADVQIFFERLAFVVGQRAASRFGGQFIGSAQIRLD